MQKLLYTLLLTIPFIGFGQGFEKTFGGANFDLGYSIQPTSDGGYIITGSTESYGNGDTDVYLIKTDANGDSLWTKTFGGPSQDYGSSLQLTSDGGYVITGRTEYANGDKDVYLIKTDANGDSLWTKTYGGTSVDFGLFVQEATDGGFIIAGATESYGNGGRDVYLLKTDINGTEQWAQTFGGSVFDVGNCVQQTTDGGYVIVGGTNSFGNGDRDAYLIKTDGNGVEQWNQTFGGVDFDLGNSVKQTTDGGYIITGRTVSFGAGNKDVYLIKTDSNGTEQWYKAFGGSDFDLGTAVHQTPDGGYVICGGTDSYGAGARDAYLIKTDGNGVELWNETFGGSSFEIANSVQLTSDGGYVIIGGTDSYGNGDRDVFLIKTSGNGNTTSIFNMPISNPNRRLEKVVDVIGRQTKPQPNNIIIEIYDDGTVEKKIIVE
jgi:hypothetical protein